MLSDTLPAGWNGAGDEDPLTFEPILPAGRTWTNVLAGIDRIEFTTFVPGFFFGFTNFDLSTDNVTIEPLSVETWTLQGNALPGVSDDPSLVGSGTLVALSNNAFDLSNAAPSAATLIVAGLSSSPVPFKGGTLVPALQVMIPTRSSAAGTMSVPFMMPAGAPAGTELWIQIAIQDDAAVSGVALSNAIRGITP